MADPSENLSEATKEESAKSCQEPKGDTKEQRKGADRRSARERRRFALPFDGSDRRKSAERRAGKDRRGD